MSVSYIPDSVKFRLWAKAAGRCQYEGCNERLWIDELTQVEFNTAYIAHIVADRPDGPRGDTILSELLKSDISNLMILCDRHHRLVDIADVAGHPAPRLRSMKSRHETRIEMVTDISADRQSHVLLYGAPIGAHSVPMSFEEARQALLPDRFPADHSAIELGLRNSAVRDDDPEYWELELRQLRTAFQQKVRSRRDAGELKHLSVFALAPQPLLIALGIELGDIGGADVFQLHREPPEWKGDADTDQGPLGVSLTPPSIMDGSPALSLSVSGEIVPSRVHAVLGQSASVWSLNVPNPNNDLVRCRAHLAEFRMFARQALHAIKTAHGSGQPLHVFPALPVSLAVELGRVWMPKADLALSVYDEMNGRFVPTFTLGPRNQEA
jgi:hypothetical protein